MAKELEIKVLGVNVEDVTLKLERMGALFEYNKLQNIYTYDFINIASQYQSILYDINMNHEKKEVTHALARLKKLFFDLNDLILENDLSGEQKTYLKKLFNTDNIYNYIKDIDSIDHIILKKLNDPLFLELIGKYRINPNKWIRLRKNGEQASITVKQILERKTLPSGVRVHDINNVLEYEIHIDSFNTAKIILEQLGYYHKNYQEKRRIKYTYKTVEIVIDSWPHIPSYLEIEGKNESDIFELLNKLGFDKKDAVSMNTDDVYTHYGLNMYSFKELKFEE